MPVYDTEKLTLELNAVGGIKSAYAVAETVFLEALLTNEGTVRYGATQLHFSYGDEDSEKAFTDLDDAFGLIETVEKHAEIYLKIAHLPKKQILTDAQLHMLEKRFGVKCREGYLD